MRNFIKLFLGIILALILCFSAGIKSYADDLSAAEELGVNLDGIGDSLSSDVSEILEENDITADNIEGISSVSVGDVLGYVVDELISRAKYPLKIFIMLVCVIILGAAVEGMGSSISDKSLGRVYGIVGVLIAVGIISEPVTECIGTASETLSSGGSFMITYIPIFSGITASSGAVTSAVAYNAMLLVASEAAVQISANYIMPITSLCMALGVIEAINPSVNITCITVFVTKAVKFVLGFIMTVFIGLLSIQSIIGASADTIGVKAAKYLVSNCVPVIGGAVADAYTTLKSSLGILRGGVGFFGIAAIFLTVVPPLASISLMKLIFATAEMLGEMFDLGGIKTLMKNASSVMSILLSLIVCFSVMLIISTAVIMMVGLDIS
ncbi:MAG: stage III sporulation protein AE [Oscillospiraceae bacterium]|nr:stage III sporulation protein AE [Oscillospiraceae bacterium]